MGFLYSFSWIFCLWSYGPLVWYVKTVGLTYIQYQCNLIVSWISFPYGQTLQIVIIQYTLDCKFRPLLGPPFEGDICKGTLLCKGRLLSLVKLISVLALANKKELFQRMVQNKNWFLFLSDWNTEERSLLSLQLQEVSWGLALLGAIHLGIC